jgi:uncharacterized protein YndB with AHSA1/START domain
MEPGSAGESRESAGLAIERTYDASPQEVWQAWTDPQALMRWFGPEDTGSMLGADLDVREGGRYRIRFTTTDGEHHEVGGEYREVQPPHKLVFTWSWRSTPERESLVTLLFQPAGAGTHLVFRHERFFDEAARQGHARGWAGAFGKLDRYLQRPAASRRF